jgi:hypothetical protein
MIIGAHWQRDYARRGSGRRLRGLGAEHRVS